MKTRQRIELKKFNNFEESSNIQVKQFYNYLPTTKLKNSSGIKEASFFCNYETEEEYHLNLKDAGIEKIEGLAYFKQYFSHNGMSTHRLLVYASDKKVYINQMLNDSNDLFWLYNLTFNTAPIALAYKNNDSDAIILASKDEMKIWKTGYSPYTISNVPIITSMCMNEGVLFCTIQEPAFKIWYATDLDAENIGNISSNSGYISLEDDLGYARKIITFDQSVYVFRDYGISKITYLKGNISVSQVYLSNTKIYTDTVNVCGNAVLFITNDGLYSFNGIKVVKADINLDNLKFNCDNAVASSLGDKYYVGLRLNFNDDKTILCEESEFTNNCLLVINVNNYEFEIIRGVDIKSMLPVKTEAFEKMLVCFNSAHSNIIGEIDNVSQCVENSLPKYWCSGELVNNVNVKLFTKLSVVADEGVKFKLIYDDKELSFTTYQKGLNNFVFKISCNKIKLEITSPNSSAEVENVYLDYYEY